MLTLAMLCLVVSIGPAAEADSPRDRAGEIVAKIRRADYEGDRGALLRLQGELAPFLGNVEIAARVRYWQGFARWRRAINGFNDAVEVKELESDLREAVDEFDAAVARDPGFADAKIAIVSCVGLLAYATRQKDPARMEEWIAEGRQRLKDVQGAAENPRLLWVLGPNVWNVPVEKGGGQAKAMQMYERGLEIIRGAKRGNDPLEPSWGEAELLMNLAWSYLNRAIPDLAAAERYARSALEQVPYWHYVRDILLPKIREARRKLNQAVKSGIIKN